MCSLSWHDEVFLSCLLLERGKKEGDWGEECWGNDWDPRHGTDPGLFKNFSSLNLAFLYFMSACFHVPVSWGRLPWKSPALSRSCWAAQLRPRFLTRRAGRREGTQFGLWLHGWATASSLDHRALWQWRQFSLSSIFKFSESLFLPQWKILSTAAAFSPLTLCQSSREKLEVLIQGFSYLCVFKLKALPHLPCGMIKNPWLLPFQCEKECCTVLTYISGEEPLGLLL